MLQFDVFTHYEPLQFGIDQRKIIISDNAELLHNIKQSIERSFSKSNTSEYAEETHNLTGLKINNESINKKMWNCYTITRDFDLDEHIKMKADSIFQNVFKTLLKNIEYDETFNTLKILFEDFGETIETMFDNEINTDIRVSLQPLTLKTLLKLLEISIEANSLKQSAYDLTGDEKMALKMELINTMAKRDPKSNYLVIINTFKLPKRLHNALNSSPQNVYTLVLSQSTFGGRLKDYLLYFNRPIDLSDDHQIFETLTEEVPCLDTLGNTKELLNSFINTSNTDKISQLRDFL